MPAETTYFFRHVLLRDAAYHMQLPQDRTEQHRNVLDIAENFWGPPPDQSEREEGAIENLPVAPHIDELCEHAQAAFDGTADDPSQQVLIHRTLGRYLRRAGQVAESRFENGKVARIYYRLATEFAIDAGRAAKDLIHASHHARFEDIELARELGQQALSEAELADKPSIRIDALIGLARVHFVSDGFKESKKLLLQAEELIQPDTPPKLMANVLSQLATTSKHTDEYQESEQRFRTAILYCKEHQLTTLECITLSNYAGLLSGAGNDAEGEKILRRVILHPERNLDHVSAPYVHGNLAESLTRKEKYAEAETQFKIALKGHIRFGNLLQQGWIGASLANLFNRVGKHQQAISCFQTATETLHRLGHMIWLGSIQAEIGQTYLYLGQDELAEQAFDMALDLQRQYDPDNLGMLESRIAEIRGAGLK